MVNWTGYLESICNAYAQWWNVYTLTDVEGQQREELESPPLFDFMVKAVQPAKEEHSQKQQKTERLDVLEGLRKYAKEHVLLVGRPGSGKSTALARLLLEEAEKVRKEQQAKIPVLVELRYYKTSVLDLIRSFFKQHGLLLDNAEIERLLFEQQFLLLVDGLNELPSEKARGDLIAFRRENAATPIIFTTRDLGVGGDLNIVKKLEIQPLNEPQMRDFVKKYLPEQGEQMLRQLGSRLREFGQTPLLLWMLCLLFKKTGNVPPNLGMVFRQFTQSYERQLRQDVPVTDESRRWWQLLLEHLALRMTQGREPTELQVAISRQEAEEILTAFLRDEGFDKPRDRALSWLQDLLNHHLIQLGASEQIEFRHQLIQEYYTAESLLKQLPQLSDDRLKREYLNYLKWTEPLALMLELVNESTQALRVVKLALEVDLRLGARLAEAVKPEFQAQMVALVTGIEIPQRVKFELLGIIRSDHAVHSLTQAWNHADYYVRWRAAEALGKIGTEAAVSALIQALKHEDYYVRWRAADELGKIGTEAAVPALIQALKHEDYYVRRRAAEALGKIGNEAAVDALLQALNDADSDVRRRAADALRKIGTEAAVPALIQALNHADSSVRSIAAEALGKTASSKLLPDLTQLLRTTTESYLLDTIAAAIQARCKFYNYTLTQPLQPISIPLMYILHLSDLHFGTTNNAHNWCNQLAEDLDKELNCPRLDALILSGDIANESTPEEYTAAKQFLDNLCQELHLQPQQIVIVPGNHDLNWRLAKKAYKLIDREEYEGELKEGYYIQESQSVVRIRDEEKYQQRFAHFSNFYEAIKGEPYPLEYEQQGILHHLPEQNLLILALNSAWQLDHHYKSRASINADALSTALTNIRRNQAYQDCLKIAVWHHPLNSAFEDRITDHGFMEQLAKAGFCFALHGHIHTAETSLYSYDLSAGGRRLNIICAGTFGAPVREWVSGYPLQYNLLKLEGNKLTVETRCREELNGAWKPDARWTQGAGKDPLPRYEIQL